MGNLPSRRLHVAVPLLLPRNVDPPRISTPDPHGSLDEGTRDHTARLGPNPGVVPGSPRWRPLSKGAGHVATVLAACGVGLVSAPPSAAGRRAGQASAVAPRAVRR